MPSSTRQCRRFSVGDFVLLTIVGLGVSAARKGKTRAASSTQYIEQGGMLPIVRRDMENGAMEAYACARERALLEVRSDPLLAELAEARTEVLRANTLAQERALIEVASDPLLAELVEARAEVFLGFARHAIRAARKQTWRSRQAWLSSSTSRVLRALERVLSEKYASRRKERRRWIIEAHVDDGVVDVVLVVLPDVRRMDDFRRPLEVVVLRPDVVDEDCIRRAVLGTVSTTRNTDP